MKDELKFNIAKLERTEVNADVFKIEFLGKAGTMTIADHEYTECATTPQIMVALITHRLKIILETIVKKRGLYETQTETD